MTFAGCKQCETEGQRNRDMPSDGTRQIDLRYRGVAQTDVSQNETTKTIARTDDDILYLVCGLADGASNC
jgi:hypothetical protein